MIILSFFQTKTKPTTTTESTITLVSSFLSYLITRVEAHTTDRVQSRLMCTGTCYTWRALQGLRLDSAIGLHRSVPSQVHLIFFSTHCDQIITFLVENPQCGELTPLQSKVTKQELSKETKYPEHLSRQGSGCAQGGAGWWGLLELRSRRRIHGAQKLSSTEWTISNPCRIYNTRSRK